MNLLKELQKTAKENAEKLNKQQDILLDAVKENIQNENNRYLEMLRHFGTGHIVSAALNTKRINERVIAGGFLSESDIKTVCDKYALKCLPASTYKNEVPLKALNDLRIFSIGKPVEDRLFMIAPGSHFKKTERPKVDPVLVYCHSIKEGMYEIVSSWGNDFNIIQRVKGAINLSGYTVRTFSLLLFVAYMADLWLASRPDSTPYTAGAVFTVLGGIGLLISIIGGGAEGWLGKPKYNENYKSFWG